MKLFIEFNNKELSIDVIYRDRKTLEIQMKSSKNIRILSPKGVKKEKLIDIIENKKQWIIKKIHELEVIEKKLGKRKFQTGGIFLYLGKEYKMKLIFKENIDNIKIKLHNEKLNIYTYTTDKIILKEALKKWYKEKALILLTNRINKYIFKINRPVRKIKVKEQKSRWGSCSSKGDLYFNYKIIMAPIEIIDYIVVHELCHLVHLNHSKRYWGLVKNVLPDYKKHRQWLKENGKELTF
ncbi:MAG: M48 family metallopeptidase [Firmicutes bacterium]|nr:M48 family metallopeptidase [Bacillota bacterium]